MSDDNWAVKLGDITYKPREWLWPDHIPSGELTLIAGIQGTGKSLITTDIVSHVTNGTNWPDKSLCPIGSAIVLQAEDSLASTVRPRYDAANADVEKVTIIKGAIVKKQLVAFNLSRDLPRLIHLVEINEDVRVIIIDPLGSYVGGIDTHKENQVRNVLFPLRIQLAEKYNIAVICVVHLKKGAEDEPILSRILGSVAFTAAARAIWCVASDPEDPSKRLFLPAKHNLTAQRGSGFELFIYTASNSEAAIRWGKESFELADDMMVDRGMKPAMAGEKAAKIIREALAKGPKPASKVIELTVKEGMCKRTVMSAKKKLGIKSTKKPGKGSEWMWSLPEES